MHLDLGQALLVGAAVVAIAGGILGIVLQLRKIRGQNEEQLAKQTRFEMAWNGDPTGIPRVPGMVERVANIEANTIGMPEWKASIESRLGKVEADRLLDREELHSHIKMHPGGYP